MQLGMLIREKLKSGSSVVISCAKVGLPFSYWADYTKHHLLYLTFTLYCIPV